jgi:glutathione synthase/RimK-type ligase-like ATP-grasp enzyme
MGESAMKVWCFDCEGVRSKNGQWGREMLESCRRAGVEAKLYKKAEDVDTSGYIFMRLAQFPPYHDSDKRLALELIERPELTFIQDRSQFLAYEDKAFQFRKWGYLMPRTWYFDDPESALEFVESYPLPIVSKSTIGSSSYNVRVLDDFAAIDEIEQVFGAGLTIRNGQVLGKQKGYLLWQEFIPHDVTWRVTIVGEKLHIYKRFNYPDVPKAAPAFVVPTEAIESYDSLEMQSLMEWSRGVFKTLGTKWCAIDVLKNVREWKMLETSLAWARGADAAGLSPFYGSEHSLMTQCDLLVEEIRRGVFDA